MKISPAERALVRERCGGLCAYCGIQLAERWQVDHFQPVIRDLEFVKRDGLTQLVSTNTPLKPQHHNLGNLLPACFPCNNDKGAWGLEEWRRKLSNGPAVLERNQPTFRHSVRFGLLQIVSKPIVFHFETLATAAGQSPAAWLASTAPAQPPRARHRRKADALPGNSVVRRAKYPDDGVTPENLRRSYPPDL